MFARLYTNNGDVKTAYSELSKVITGVITSPASLTAFNSSTSTIDTTQPSNWEEYTTVGSTNTVNAGVAVWFRQKNKAGRWKYAAIYRTTSPTNTHKGLIRHYTVDQPSVPDSVAGVATNNSEAYGLTTEFTVAAGPRYLIVATRLTTNSYFTEAHMWLEHPDTEHASFYSLPDHVLYRHFGTGASYATDATTDIAYSTGIVEVAKAGNADVAVYNGGMSTPDSTHGTMKPSYFTSLTNTLSGSSSFVAYPFSSLFYVSPYTGHLDCSTLTNVWGTGASLGVPNSNAPSGMSLLTCATNAIEDLSTNSFTVTAVGNTVVTSSSPFASGYSNYFDGNGDYLSIPTNAAFSFGTGDFTVEAWIYLAGNSAVDSGGYRHAAIISTHSGNGSGAANQGWEIMIGGSATTTGVTGLYIENFSAGAYTSTGTSFSISQQVWHHIAITRQSGTVRFFFNGTQQDVNKSFTSNMTSGGACWIGAFSLPGYVRYINGYISNLRVVKGTALYTGTFTPATSSLPAGFSSNPAYGESVTINGSDYAFLKANGSLSYLVPKR